MSYLILCGEILVAIQGNMQFKKKFKEIWSGLSKLDKERELSLKMILKLESILHLVPLLAMSFFFFLNPQLYMYTHTRTHAHALTRSHTHI